MAQLQSFIKPSDYIKPHAEEAVKMYFVYDGSGRMTETYTAMVNAENNDKCLKTEYTYDGASTRVQKMKESIALWSSAYDI